MHTSISFPFTMRQHFGKTPAIVGIAYFVSLISTFALMSPEGTLFTGMSEKMEAAALMLFFGPYLLPVGFTTGFFPSPESLFGIAAVMPFLAAHIVFLSILSKRIPLWRRLGRHGKCARKTVLALWILLSATGAWYEMPIVTRYDVAVDDGKIPPTGLRLAVVSDLHSCRYGAGQRAFVKAIHAQKPDAVLMVGDIFDDRMPDGNAEDFVSAVASAYPCLYVFGNHEHWSRRIPEIRDILVSSGVAVLEGNVKTLTVGGMEIAFCGIDDPTYMADDAWLGQLAAVDIAAPPSRLKILLSHRPEYSGEYAKHDFDLVLSGHLHGGQWRIPGFDLGVYGPSAGGPRSGERHLFPRRAGGVHSLNGHTTLVVSRGLARESTPLPRFFNHPELVVVDLRKK